MASVRSLCLPQAALCLMPQHWLQSGRSPFLALWQFDVFFVAGHLRLAQCNRFRLPQTPWIPINFAVSKQLTGDFSISTSTESPAS